MNEKEKFFKEFNDGTIFGAGTMGFLINNANGNPFIARFVESNTLNQNTKLGIVIMDFVSEELSKEIYRRNY